MMMRLISLLLPLRMYAQSILCNDEVTGNMASGEILEFSFTIYTTKNDVTFTNCNSDFDTTMSLYTSSGVQVTSSNCSDSNDCSDSNYYCSSLNHETFTFTTLPAGNYKLKLGGYDYSYGQYQIKAICPAATLSPIDYINGQFPGHTLIVKGFNIFKAETSGSPILDINYIKNNTETYTTEGTTCSYSSLEFNSQYSHYSSFSQSDSESLSIQFSSGKTFGAGGSFSDTRTTTKTYAESAQYYIYAINLQCVASQASVNAYNQLYWNPNFVNALRVLPQSYSSGDSMDNFIEFWDVYGTHFIETAKFGGKITGTTIVNKCNVEQIYESVMQYETCLNGAYKGISIEGCKEDSDSSSTSIKSSLSVDNIQITVKGGDASTYTKVFNSFGDKSHDFQFWIADLTTYPDVVGGNLHEIHNVIQDTIKLGDHKLNNGISTSINDDTFLAISYALEEAYIDYSKQIAKKENYFGDGECAIDCNGHKTNWTECVCQQCVSVAQCCGFSKAHQLKVSIISLFVCVILFCFRMF